MITAGLLLGLGFFAYKAIVSLAGKETSVLAALTLLRSSQGLPWLLAVLMVLWALSERQLRRFKTRSMSARIQELEKHIDPKRTTSGLSPTGQSNLEDE
ncbi:MAG: hypothetical protein OXN84_07715 [Albidovulum sp.]|nr:hypothetical protein [Albidovulum sp.]